MKIWEFTVTEKNSERTKNVIWIFKIIYKEFYVCNTTEEAHNFDHYHPGSDIKPCKNVLQ